ncbi:MAG: hypothetical protein BACC_04475 [Bacteroides sp.]
MDQAFMSKDGDIIVVKRGSAKKLIMVLLACSVVVFLVVMFVRPWADQLYQQSLDDEIKNDMVVLADSGKSAAVLWLAEKYPDSGYITQLDALIDQGVAQAMVIKARTVYKFDPDRAYQLMVQAAQEGDAQAVWFLKNHQQ